MPCGKNWPAPLLLHARLVDYRAVAVRDRPRPRSFAGAFYRRVSERADGSAAGVDDADVVTRGPVREDLDVHDQARYAVAEFLPARAALLHWVSAALRPSSVPARDLLLYSNAYRLGEG
jgi:hypothetical protein